MFEAGPQNTNKIIVFLYLSRCTRRSSEGRMSALSHSRIYFSPDLNSGKISFLKGSQNFPCFWYNFLGVKFPITRPKENSEEQVQ